MSALKIIAGLWLITFSLFLQHLPVYAAELTKDKFNYFINGQTTIEGAIGHTVTCAVVGISLFNKDGCLGYDVKNKQPLVLDQLPHGGALGGIGSAIATLYTNPPASSTQYLANLGENIGLGPKSAQAQVIGSGEGIVHPVLEIWKIIRNLTYLFFIAIFLVVGLMVMLRQKINPQTVISVQQALPSLVLGLILVTFSYFIASLLIDLTFVGIQLVTQIFTTGSLANSSYLGSNEQIKALASNANVFQLFAASGINWNNLSSVSEGIGGKLPQTFGVLAYLIPATAGAIIGGLLAGPVGGTVIGGAIGAAAPNIIIPTLVIIILLIALFIQMFRLLFGLLGTYIQILIFTIAGPLYILIGSIPGRGGVIGMWWKGLLANALVFPAVFAAFLFAGFILGPIAKSSWGNTTLPFFGGIDGSFMRALIAFGILLGIPAIPEMVRGAFGVKGPQGFAQTALGGFMAGVGVGRSAMGAGYRRVAGNYIRAQEQNQKLQVEKNVPSVNKIDIGPEWVRELIRRGWLPRGGK